MTVRSICSRAAAALGAGAIVVSMTLGAAGPAAADGVPFSDPNAQGTIGLCDAHGHPITSGRLTDRPFASTAVSSVAATEGISVKTNAKATLYAYQPRRNIDPGEWSGQQLTGSSVYSNDAHPMAAGTILDSSLADNLSAYPAQWDGLVQLRMFFSSPSQGVITSPYPAAVIQVTGSTWKLVSGSSRDDCQAGKAVSSETQLLPQSKFASASASAARRSAAESATASAQAGKSSPATASATGTSPSASSNPGATDSGEVSAQTSPASSSHLLAIVLGALAVVALVGAVGIGLWTRGSRAGH